jgi:alpha-L-fucosidase 2
MTTHAVSPTLLWYRAPAARWEEALPVGNGQVGAMVFGGVAEERLQLNEKSLWSGGPYDADNPDALPALARIRSLLFEGHHAAADELARRTQVCKGRGSNSGDAPRSDYGCYQTLGDLLLAFVDPPVAAREGEEGPRVAGAIADYRRELDLDEGIARVRFLAGGDPFVREVFASAVDGVLVVHLSGARAGAVSLVARLARSECAQTGADGERGLRMGGRMFRGGAQTGMRFDARLRVVAHGGEVRCEDGGVRVSRADAVTLLVAAGTDHRDASFEQAVEARVARAAGAPYADLRARHLQDHRRLFRRLTLQLGAAEGAAAPALPTDERLALAAEGAHDPALSALYCQLGRYLLLASSRPGAPAANLQGIWADGTQTPWNGDYHTNINIQMNYWLAETGNLGECAEPLVDLIDGMRAPGRRTAAVHHGARGWAVHTLHNLWGYTSPGEDPSWGLSPMAGPWLCQHLWEHYAFGRDEAYLRRVYPILRESAEFCLDWLVEDPRTGRLVSGPAPSPENKFVARDGQACSLTMAPSMDQEIAWDHLTNVLDAAAVLGVRDGFVDAVRAARDRLAMPRIGSDGRLLEWADELRETEPEHRHVSHLFALHPGRQITPLATPGWAEAARKTLAGRGDGGTGWSMAWKICFWARLGDGDHAASLLANLVFPCDRRKSGAGVYPNLFCAHPPFQIDGNLGGAAGVLEMLVQSHDGAIALLPALPRAWPTGQVTGVRARGGFEVDVAWSGGELTRAEVRCTAAGACAVRHRGRVVRRELAAGERWPIGAAAFSP